MEFIATAAGQVVAGSSEILRFRIRTQRDGRLRPHRRQGHPRLQELGQPAIGYRRSLPYQCQHGLPTRRNYSLLINASNRYHR